MAPAGTPGGGPPREDYAVPRSDITPQVLEAVRAMNATKDNKGNLHDDGNGRFVSKGDMGFNQPDGDVSSGDKELDKPRKTGKIKRKRRGRIKVPDEDMATIVENLKLRKPPVGTVQHAKGASHDYTVYVESEDYFVVINKERLP